MLHEDSAEVRQCKRQVKQGFYLFIYLFNECTGICDLKKTGNLTENFQRREAM